LHEESSPDWIGSSLNECHSCGPWCSAAYLFFKKSWQWSTTIAFIVGAFFFIIALPPTREFMRATAWAAFVTALEATGQGLVRLNSVIDDIRKGMETEQGKRQQQQAELGRIQTETREMQTALKTAQDALNEQQKKLADINQLLKAFYRAGRTVYVETTSDHDALAIVSHSENQVTLYALLPDVPIPQTLQLQYHVAVQPRISYYSDNNLITFWWAQNEASLRSKPMAFSYVPDP
jgi:hypothetical protein